MTWLRRLALAVLVSGAFVAPSDVAAGPASVCAVPPAPCSAHPCASCAGCNWDTADIDPATGIQTRNGYLNVIKQRVNNDGNGKRISATMWSRVLAACNKHAVDRNCNSTVAPNAGHCNSLLITEAAQCSGPADNDTGWATVAEKLEQGH